MKAQITRMKINLPKLFFLKKVRAGTSNFCNIRLVKIKNSKDIFGSSKCKVTFGFKYISDPSIAHADAVEIVILMHLYI